MKPDISIIIGFYNKINLLEKILEALRLQRLQNFEVVIADDGSNEAVVERIRALQAVSPFPIQHVWHEDKGWRKNRILNKAVVTAQGDYLIFIDGDCIPDPHFVEDHYTERKKRTVVSGRRILMGSRATAYLLSCPLTKQRFGCGLFLALLSDTLHGYKTRMEHMIRIRSAWIRRLFIKDYERFILGCNFSMYKEDLLAVNGFDERFEHPGYGEDIDLWNRLTRAGIRSYSRKGLLIQYHCWHPRFDTNYAPNKQLLEENTQQKVTFTPFGIVRARGAMQTTSSR